ncbi:S-layer homology domain-containing protein, partial [Paenibacillus sp. N3.4]|uniref:S-layer homology domain-containing protein n=1 Tax=Paenibacillus sp. N3.4 TaxID=2603222 RepID=UPI0011C7793D
TGIWNNLGGVVNSDGTITVTLPHFSKYAVLEKVGTNASLKTFYDIQGHWAQKEIDQLVVSKIIDGMDETSFKPDANLTRAQFVAMLFRALKLQNPSQAVTFDDVTNDSWYKDSVYAAHEANIVNGVSDHKFKPEANITREQMAVMMVNAYLHVTNKKLSDITITTVAKYADSGSISDWARTYVNIASSLGLLTGYDETNFAPALDSSRAQAAVVINRLLNIITSNSSK